LFIGLSSMRAMALVRLRGPLRRLAGDNPQHAIDGATVGELLVEIEREHPAARGWILDERGVLRQHINVFVNGELGRQDTEVAADDQVDVLPALSGG
jgi:molybdopterin synthase sulfur carrier subunit